MNNFTNTKLPTDADLRRMRDIALNLQFEGSLNMETAAAVVKAIASLTMPVPFSPSHAFDFLNLLPAGYLSTTEFASMIEQDLAVVQMEYLAYGGFGGISPTVMRNGSIAWQASRVREFIQEWDK